MSQGENMPLEAGEAVNLNIEGIPPELKDLPQWVVYTWPGKVPMSCLTVEPAKTNDPETWGSFDLAVELCLAHQSIGIGIGGVGFVLSPNDPYCGVDLTNCRDPITGEIELWARDIIDRLKSCTELSPSGSGVHILLRGTLPGKGRKVRRGAGTVQLRGERFYFAMTGQHLTGTPTTIEERQGELSKLYFESLSWWGDATPQGSTWKGNPRAAIRAIKELLAESDNGCKRVLHMDLVKRIMANQECCESVAKMVILTAAKPPYRFITKGKNGFKGWKIRNPYFR